MVLEKNGIQYRTLTEEWLQETIRFITQHFIAHEYLTRESKLTHEEFGLFAQLYCEASLSHGLSLIAIDTETNELVGFAINEDPNSTAAVDANLFFNISDHFIPFLGMLSELSEKHLSIERKPNYSFHLYLLGVKPSHQGRGIGSTLVEVSEIVARWHRFTYVVVEATSPGTKPICEKRNYINLGNNPYQDFTIRNSKPYSHIIDYTGPYLFIKDVSKGEVIYEPAQRNLDTQKVWLQARA